MANYRVEVIEASTQPQGIPSSSNFIDQEGSAYFVELEEALMQGVAGIRRAEATHGERTILTSRPPTLEIFPSWPMRFQQIAKGEESSGSGSSAHNTSCYQDSDSPVSRKDCVDHSTESKKKDMLATNQGETQKKKGIGGSPNGKNEKLVDAKTLRRLAQNREAARKSRLRKKAYIQQLESGRIKLTQLEHELHRINSQGSFLGGDANPSEGAAMFDNEYGRWVEENYKHMRELRGGLQGHLPDNDLRLIVDGCLSNYDDIFRLKATAARDDVLHLLSGMWKTPAERCFLWMGGFRPSDIIKMVMPTLDPLTEQQYMGVCNLQQSSQQAEEALTQGFDQLNRSLAETMAAGPLITSHSTNAAEYMAQMAVALSKIAHLEAFVLQADNLRQQTLHHLRRVLTIRQAARCFLAICEYYNRLRALSSLWASRPREVDMAIDESVCAPPVILQMVQQSVHNHFSAF